jgi:hypothetical protein
MRTLFENKIERTGRDRNRHRSCTYHDCQLLVRSPKAKRRPVPHQRLQSQQSPIPLFGDGFRIFPQSLNRRRIKLKQTLPPPMHAAPIPTRSKTRKCLGIACLVITSMWGGPPQLFHPDRIRGILCFTRAVLALTTPLLPKVAPKHPRQRIFLFPSLHIKLQIAGFPIYGSKFWGFAGPPLTRPLPENHKEEPCHEL